MRQTDATADAAADVAQQSRRLATDAVNTAATIIDEAAVGAPGLGKDLGAKADAVGEQLAAAGYVGGQGGAQMIGILSKLVDAVGRIQVEQIEHAFTDGTRLVEGLVNARDPDAVAHQISAHWQRRARHTSDGAAKTLDVYREASVEISHDVAERYTALLQVIRRDWSNDGRRNRPT